MNESNVKRRRLLEAGAVFAAAIAFLLTLAPSAPFTKELGVCESGAVRDVLAGHIILPYFLPGPMVHVPPLYWWTAALCVKAFGWNELALRMPSMAAAALTCAIVFAWCSATIGRQAALWSALALLLCHFYLDAARQPRMDSMLALFVTAAAASLERALTTRRTECFIVAALAIGLGCLSKGILGIVLPGVVVALFILVRRRLAELFHPALIGTFTAGLAIGVGWFVAGYERGGHQFLDWQVKMNLWSRFVPAAAGGAAYCAHPFWYFGPQTLSGFLPWSLYLPAFAAMAWHRRRNLPEATMFGICWFGAIFIFFSSSHGKCLVYILPAFPPLAILAGWTIAEIQAADWLSANPDKQSSAAPAGLFESGNRRSADAAGRQPSVVPAGLQGNSITSIAMARWGPRLFSLGSAIIALGAIAIVAATILVLVIASGPAMFHIRLHPTDRRFLAIFTAMAARFSPVLLSWLLLYCAGIGLIIFGLLRSGWRLQAVGTLIIAAAGSWFWFAEMNPTMAQRETLRGFAHEVAAIVPRDASIGHVGLGDCELNFYSPQPLPVLNSLSCSSQDTMPQYIVIRQRDFDAIARNRLPQDGAEPRATTNPLHNGQHRSSMSRRGSNEASYRETKNQTDTSCLEVVLESAPVDSIGPRLLLKRKPDH